MLSLSLVSAGSSSTNNSYTLEPYSSLLPKTPKEPCPQRSRDNVQGEAFIQVYIHIYTTYIYIYINRKTTRTIQIYSGILIIRTKHRDITDETKERQVDSHTHLFLSRDIGANPLCHSPTNGWVRQKKIVVVGGWGNFVLPREKWIPPTLSHTMANIKIKYDTNMTTCLKC